MEEGEIAVESFVLSISSPPPLLAISRSLRRLSRRLFVSLWEEEEERGRGVASVKDAFRKENLPSPSPHLASRDAGGGCGGGEAAESASGNNERKTKQHCSPDFPLREKLVTHSK